jgi:hypothetical protein
LALTGTRGNDERNIGKCANWRVTVNELKLQIHVSVDMKLEISTTKTATFSRCVTNQSLACDPIQRQAAIIPCELFAMSLCVGLRGMAN